MADILNGPAHTQAPRYPAPFPSRGLHPDDQFQRNQPFYVPTPQRYYQWPMSTSYVPYSGFPELGYGLVVPSLLYSPYPEIPGYMLPHAQLHILDYRRMMSPHTAIAQQARRFRFPNNVPLNRVMVSSEVQTEPLCHNLGQDAYRHAASSHTGSESGRGTGTGSPLSTSPSLFDNKSVAGPEETSVLTQNHVATNTINATERSAVTKSKIFLHTDKVQIKCSETPLNLKIVHIKENCELLGNRNGDLLQCSLGSMHSSEDGVLCSYQSLAFKKDKQRVEAGKLTSSKPCLHACTGITMVSACPSEKFKAHPKPGRSDITQSIDTNKSKEMQNLKIQNDSKRKSFQKPYRNVSCKILRLPFDMKHLNQPRQLEASIWSVESQMPYVPSAEWMIENDLITPQKPPLLMETHKVFLATKQSSLDCISVGKNLRTGASNKNYDQNSLKYLESSSPYHPSMSWLADFGNVYYYSKLPVTPQQHGSVERQITKTSRVSPVAKVLQPIRSELSPPKYEKKTRNQEQAVSFCVSDKKHRSFHFYKCTPKSRFQDDSGSPRFEGPGMRCSLTSHSTLVDKIAFCPSCKFATRGKDHRSFPLADILGSKIEESAEVKTFYKSTVGGIVRACESQKMSLGSHTGSADCNVIHQAKLRQQTELCENSKCCHASLDWGSTGDHGRSIWENSKEDEILSASWRWKEAEQRLQTPQKGKSRKEYMQESGIDSRGRPRKTWKNAHNYMVPQRPCERETSLMTTFLQYAHPVKEVH